MGMQIKFKSLIRKKFKEILKCQEMPLLKQSRQIFKIIQSQKDSAKFWIQNAPVQWDNEIPMFSVRIIVAAFGAKGVFRGEWNCNVSGELEPY